MFCRRKGKNNRQNFRRKFRAFDKTSGSIIGIGTENRYNKTITDDKKHPALLYVAYGRRKFLRAQRMFENSRNHKRGNCCYV